jgi:hypothetical protein
MSAYDWATGTLASVVTLLRTNNLDLIALPDGTSAGPPDNSNPGSVPDNVAAVVQSMGLVADTLLYDAVEGGPADVTVPFAINGTALAASGNTRIITLVSYYSAKTVSRLLNESRMLQAISGQPGFLIDKLIKAWSSDTDKWLAMVRNGERCLQLDRATPSIPGYGAISAVVKPPTFYPGIPQRPVAYTIPTPNGSPVDPGPGQAGIVL